MGSQQAASHESLNLKEYRVPPKTDEIYGFPLKTVLLFNNLRKSKVRQIGHRHQHGH